MSIKDCTYNNVINTKDLYCDLVCRALVDCNLNEKENKIFTILDIWYNDYDLVEDYPIIEDSKVIDIFKLSYELLNSDRTPKQDKMLNKLTEWWTNTNNIELYL